MTFREVIRILMDHGFSRTKQSGSHRTYRGTVGGLTQVVVAHPVPWTQVVILAYSREGDEIKKGTLGSIIRQSGLDKKLFR